MIEDDTPRCPALFRSDSQSQGKASEIFFQSLKRRRTFEKGGGMARRSQHSFLKRQKEVKRKEEAAEKMARRHGKKSRAREAAETEQGVSDVTAGEHES